MKPLYRFIMSIFLVSLFLNGARAEGEEFNAEDCVITAIEPQFNLSDSRYRLGGLCNGVHSFSLRIIWDHWYGRVNEDFESEQYGNGDLRASCPDDPVIFDGDCTNVSLTGVYKKIGKLVSRDRMTREQKTVLKQEFDSIVPPPSIDSPEAREFFGEQYKVSENLYRVPLRLTILEPGINLKFQLKALVSDDSGQVTMQEVLTKNWTYYWFWVGEEDPVFESSMLLPAGVYSLHASARTVFIQGMESSAGFTVGDRVKAKKALTLEALREGIEMPMEANATQTLNLDKAAIAPTKSSKGIDRAAISPSYSKFTVISPRSDVRYSEAPTLKVFVPQRDDVIYAMILCAGPNQRQPCDHKEGGIAADSLTCAYGDTQCSAELSFGFEMPFDKSYSLYVRPNASTDLVEVNFEMTAMAEQLAPQAMSKSVAVSKDGISMARVATGVIVTAIEQRTDPLKAGQPFDLKVWLKNMSSTKSDAGLKYSVVCEVKAGGGACPFRDAAYSVDSPIEPGARHAVKLTGSVADAGTYAITVAAPLPGKGEPFTGNSVTKTIEVISGKMPIKRAAIKRQPEQ